MTAHPTAPQGAPDAKCRKSKLTSGEHRFWSGGEPQEFCVDCGLPRLQGAPDRSPEVHDLLDQLCELVSGHEGDPGESEQILGLRLEIQRRSAEREAEKAELERLREAVEDPWLVSLQARLEESMANGYAACVVLGRERQEGVLAAIKRLREPQPQGASEGQEGDRD